MEPRAESATDPALAPFMAELELCGSLVEAAAVTTRALVEDFGAIGAVLFDEQGPVAAHPVRIPAGLIAELGEVRPGVGAWSPIEIDDGLVAISYRIPGSQHVRIAASWGQENSAPASRLRTLADVLAGWNETAPPDGSSRDEPLSPRERLQLHKEDFTNLIETIPAVLYVAEMGTDGRWHYVSPQIRTVLGYTQEEWIADPESWYRAIHPEDVEHAVSFEDQRLIGLDMHPPAEYRMRKRDGRYIWVYERARLVRNLDGKPLWYGVIQDVTALKEAEIGLARKAEQQALLAKLGEMALRGDDPDRLLSTIARRIAGLDRVIEASVWEETGPDLLGLVTRSGHLGTADSIPFVTTAFPGEQLARGEPILIPDWDGEQSGLEPYRELVPRQAVSSFAAPIVGPTEKFGLILVHSDQVNAFTPEDCDFLMTAAGLFGNAIQRHRSDRSLHHRLDHDVLTELPNRRYFENRLGADLAAAEREGTTVGLVFLDLDHFKLINDGIGHRAGDEVLRSVAPRLLSSVRPQDTVARLGGDEFGVILPEISNTDEPVEVAELILAAISGPVLIEGAERRITASAGVSIRFPGAGDHRSAAEMIREADAAMYSAKEAGRSRVHVFDEVIQERVVRRLKVEHELHDAIERDEFTLRFQPIIELRGGTLTGFEALVRWDHPTEGLLAPDRFVPVAEESELIREIDSWVLGQAIETAAGWNRDRPPGSEIGISVNSSSRQLANHGLIDLVSGLLARTGLPPRLLTIELTETGLLSGSGLIRSTLDGLNRMGARLSLDDFGTGFSSLGYLGEFPLDEIKIDRVFIDRLNHGDPRGSTIAEAIIRIGTALSMTVVAEAVTTKPTLEKVRDMGCHRAQGYLIGRPLEAASAAQLIADQR